MGVVQDPFVRPGSSHRTIRHLHFINMNFITFFLPILLVSTAVQAETFAEKLAVFIGDTPAGYTVTQMVKDGENCHCRVPGSSSSAITTAQLTTEADTTTDATTTDATTATTDTTTATTATTATTFNTASAGSAAADSDTGPGSALTADFDTGSAAGR